MIPTVDNLGQPLSGIARASHEFLLRRGMVDGSWVQGGQTGFWAEDEPEPHETLHTIQEESPEMDSVIKELAVNIGEMANQWGINVYKNGKNGIQQWIVNNPQYREGEGADELALANTPSPPRDDPRLFVSAVPRKTVALRSE